MRIFIIFKHILKETVPYFFLFKHTREQLYDNNSSEKNMIIFSITYPIYIDEVKTF